jgi:hypothetical protein
MMKLEKLKGSKESLAGVKGQLGDLEAQTGKLRARVDEAKAEAREKVDKMVACLDETLLRIKALGLTLKDFELENGVIPSVRATLHGAVDAVDAERIDKMIAENEDNEVLTATLKALRMATRYKDRLAVFDLRGVEVDLTLGLPPSVSVRFV